MIWVARGCIPLLIHFFKPVGVALYFYIIPGTVSLALHYRRMMQTTFFHQVVGARGRRLEKKS